MPRDPIAEAWKTVRGPKPLKSRFTALYRVLEQADGPELDRLLVAFLDRTISTGKLDDAVASGVTASHDPTRKLPPVPATRSWPDVRGPHDLKLEPPGVRTALSLVIAALARRARARPALVAWLFEACKLYAAERKQALAELDALDPDPAALADGAAELVRFAAAVPKPGVEVLRDVVAHWHARPLWSLHLISALAADRAADDALGRRLLGFEFGPLEQPSPAWTEALGDPDLRARLLALTTDAGAAVRALALHTLARAGIDTADLRPAVLAGLADPAPRVVIVAAAVAQQRELLTDDLAAAARTRRAQPPRTADLDEALDALLAALHDHGHALAVRACGRGLLVEHPGELVGVAWLNGQVLVPYRRPLTRTRASSARTDRDELGVLVAVDGAVARHRLPVEFPIRMTGADGARRALRLATVVAGRLVLTLHSPFAADDGWGARNYVLGFDPRDASWWTYAGPDLQANPLAAERESDLTSVALGEAFVYAVDDRPVLAVDDTPWHLDGVESGPAVRAARKRQSAAADRLPWRRISSDRSDTAGPLWQLHTADPGESIAVDTAPLRDALAAAPRLLHGSVADGRLAVVVATRPLPGLQREALLILPRA